MLGFGGLSGRKGVVLERKGDDGKLWEGECCVG